MNAISGIQEGFTEKYDNVDFNYINESNLFYINREFKNSVVTISKSKIGKCYFRNCKVFIVNSTVTTIMTFINCNVLIVDSKILDVIASNSIFSMKDVEYHNVTITNGTKYQIENCKSVKSIISPIKYGLYVQT